MAVTDVVLTQFANRIIPPGSGIYVTVETRRSPDARGSFVEVRVERYAYILSDGDGPLMIGALVKFFISDFDIASLGMQDLLFLLQHRIREAVSTAVEAMKPNRQERQAEEPNGGKRAIDLSGVVNG